jgi:FecR protein
MKTKNIQKAHKLVMALAVGLGGGVWFSSAFAAGNVDTARGEVSVLSRDGAPRGVAKGDRISEGETILTGPDGELLLTTDDSGVLAIRPRSRLTIDTYKVNGNDKDSVVLNLLRGGLRSVTGWISKTAPKNYRVTTNTATVGIRGTDHEVAIVEEGDNSGTWNKVTEGGTVLSSNNGSIEQTPTSNGTGRVRAGDQAPTPAPPPLTLFAPRPSDQRVGELKQDAQTNQPQRLQTRQQQVSGSGGVSPQGNPRVSAQCAPDAPAQQALDALLRAYERGDIGFIQQRIDPAMIGYGVLINDIISDNNAQRQTRVQITDRQMQCGPDVAVIDFAWEKYYLASGNFQPVVTRGRGSVLISGLGNGLNGQWRISGLVGDSPLRSGGVGVDATVQALPSAVSFGNAPSGCVAGMVTGTANATATIPPVAMGVPFSPSSPPPCTIPAISAAFNCSINAPGVFAPVNPPPSFVFPACTFISFASVFTPAPGVLNYTVTSTTPQTINAPGGTTINVNIPITLTGTGTILAPATGTFTGSSTINASCNALVTLPPAAPVCTPTPTNLSASIQVNDADLTTASLVVQVQASNGDGETLLLPRISPGVYQLSSVPITRGAAAVSPGSGRFELVGASPTSVTLTIRYQDQRTSTGTSSLRQTTMVLTP